MKRWAQELKMTDVSTGLCLKPITTPFHSMHKKEEFYPSHAKLLMRCDIPISLARCISATHQARVKSLNPLKAASRNLNHLPPPQVCEHGPGRLETLKICRY